MVDVICALRMPGPPPQPTMSVLGRSYRNPGPVRRRRLRTLNDRPHATPTSQEPQQGQAEQERQVRLTAQDILLRNLRITAQRYRRWWHRTPPPAPAWPGIRLNLARALLSKFSLGRCQFGYADFVDARFTDQAIFAGARFTEMIDFMGARFTNGANFASAQFAEMANLRRARVASAAAPGSVWPPGWTTRPAKPDNGE
ncbi:MAG TPA: pentapeptide repeat-containing protein, partial [Pseudonocardiaceae bacterium]|nr:pentapeptide repeat-containing protein [Pseudonocardiaceae bacterium]